MSTFPVIVLVIAFIFAERSCSKNSNGQITCSFYPSECWCQATVVNSNNVNVSLICWTNTEYYAQVFGLGANAKCSAVNYATPPTESTLDLSDYVKFSDLPVFINESFVREVVESTYARINAIPECCTYDELSQATKNSQSSATNDSIAPWIIVAVLFAVIVAAVIFLVLFWYRRQRFTDKPAEDSVYSLQSKVGTLKDEINWLRTELGKRGPIEMTAMQPWCEEEEPTDDETESYYSSASTISSN